LRAAAVVVQVLAEARLPVPAEPLVPAPLREEPELLLALAQAFRVPVLA
jgi:hypothetical protein